MRPIRPMVLLRHMAQKLRWLVKNHGTLRLVMSLIKEMSLRMEFGMTMRRWKMSPMRLPMRPAT